ncbi:MAG: class I SAM-dependent methyltransferase [Deltaproteobacteria bacterium]|nr:class I SAM-dependent methyltransferase [Deltaproteobacteria bacterium]
MLRVLLSHPLTRNIGLDEPKTTDLRRRIIRNKPLLRQIHDEWYGLIQKALPPREGAVLEVGAGAGFLREWIPDVFESDLLWSPGLRSVLDAQALPFSDNTLRAIVMTNVLHHFPRPALFFSEATRCVVPGGVVIMVEPWVTYWSRFVYGRLHHEPFDPKAADWSFPEEGPLSGANSALPWIVFDRDRSKFEQPFPEWHIQEILPMTPLVYLLSGGVSMRSLMPGWTFGFWRRLEELMEPRMDRLAMFALIVIVRPPSAPPTRI